MPTRAAAGRKVFELEDSSSVRLPAAQLLRHTPRDVLPAAARLGEQFLTANRSVLSQAGVSGHVTTDGDQAYVRLAASNVVGAVPLLSPTTGAVDYGLIVRPRFGWAGLGSMLGRMGWKVVPSPLRLPLLPKTERRIPSWVISSIVLPRLDQLLRQLQRRFELVELDLRAPKGRVSWQGYATQRLPHGRFDQVPCRFADLRDDQLLRSAISFAAGKHMASLERERGSASVVERLIELAATILREVRDAPPRRPSSTTIEMWLRRPLPVGAFQQGVQAIEWTADDRGLGGTADLEGLPWKLDMEAFFEAWVETLVRELAPRLGGSVRTGRQKQTLSPLTWDPPFVGSQRYLLPDVVLEREGHTIVFDAKYKAHWEDLNIDSWWGMEDELRNRHREDLLQVLAYSTVFQTPRVACCLVYPCHRATWESLRDRGRLIHRASVASGSRSVDLSLTAVPMDFDHRVLDQLARVMS